MTMARAIQNLAQACFGRETMTYRFIVTTGKGSVWIVVGYSRSHAVTKFRKEFEGAEIASIVEADGLL